MNFNLKDIVELDRRTPSHVANSILRGGKGTVSALHIDGVTVTFWKESLAFPTAKRELRFSYGGNTVRPTKDLNNISASLAAEVQKLPELKVFAKGTFGEFSEGDRVQLKTHTIKGIPKSGATGVIEEIGPVNIRVLFDKTYKGVYDSTCQRLRLPYPYLSSTNAGMNINLLERVQEEVATNTCCAPIRMGYYGHASYCAQLKVFKRGPEYEPPAKYDYDATLDLLAMNLIVPPNRSALLRRENPMIPRLVLQAGVDLDALPIKIKVNAGYGVTELVLDMDPEAVVALITALAEALA